MASFSKPAKATKHNHVEHDSLPSYVALEERSDIPWDEQGLAAFKNKHLGQRCFIIGNGPSLKQTDLDLLSNEITFAVNSIFLAFPTTTFRPTYYSVVDSFVIEENTDEILDLECKHKFFPSIYRKYIPANKRNNVSFFRLNRGFNETLSPNYGISRFSADCSERIYDNQTVTYVNLQLAYYMGFSEVFLIGVDFSYVIPDSAIVDGCNITSTEDDPNHFHPGYFGKGRSWHDPVLHRVIRGYQFSRLVYEWSNRTVYNATVGGKLEVFKRRDYYSLFTSRDYTSSVVFDPSCSSQGNLLGPVVTGSSLSAFMIAPLCDELIEYRAPFSSRNFLIVTLVSDSPIDPSSLRINLNGIGLELGQCRYYQTGDELLGHGLDLIVNTIPHQIIENMGIYYAISVCSLLCLQSIKVLDKLPFDYALLGRVEKSRECVLNHNDQHYNSGRIIASAVKMYKSGNYPAALSLFLQAKDKYPFKSLDYTISVCKAKLHDSIPS